MGNLSYKAIDVDNHYYEPLDAFTRHLDKEFKRRGVQMVTARQAHVGRHRRPRQPLRPQSHFRPDHHAGLPGPVVPR